MSHSDMALILVAIGWLCAPIGGHFGHHPKAKFAVCDCFYMGGCFFLPTRPWVQLGMAWGTLAMEVHR